VELLVAAPCAAHRDCHASARGVAVDRAAKELPPRPWLAKSDVEALHPSPIGEESHATSFLAVIKIRFFTHGGSSGALGVTGAAPGDESTELGVAGSERCTRWTGSMLSFRGGRAEWPKSGLMPAIGIEEGGGAEISVRVASGDAKPKDRDGPVAQDMSPASRPTKETAEAANRDGGANDCGSPVVAKQSAAGVMEEARECLNSSCFGDITCEASLDKPARSHSCALTADHGSSRTTSVLPLWLGADRRPSLKSAATAINSLVAALGRNSPKVHS